MHAVGSRHRTARAATYCVIATAALVAVRNATVYPAVLGYDAQEALDYAEGLVEHGRLPEGTGSYYTPPGFFAVAGVGLEVSDRLGLDHRERTAQVFNALAAAGTLVLLLVLLRLLWPGRDVLHLAAVVFCAVCPVVLKAAAMVHPDPLSMLLSTGALVLAARLLVRSDHRLLTAVALGACLGLAQLVRAWTLWTLGVVVAVLVVAAATRVGERRRLGVATAVTVVVALLVPAPWYAHQLAHYDTALFGRLPARRHHQLVVVGAQHRVAGRARAKHGRSRQDDAARHLLGHARILCALVACRNEIQSGWIALGHAQPAFHRSGTSNKTFLFRQSRVRRIAAGNPRNVGNFAC